MPATKVNLSQMIDLAVVTPREGAVNNALHTVLHAMLRQLGIDVPTEANLNDCDRDVLSALQTRELSVLSDIDSGMGGDTKQSRLGDAEDALGERSSSMPTPTAKRTPHQVDAEDTGVQTNEKGIDKAARRESERQRQMEWEQQRKERLLAEKAREYEQPCAAKSKSCNLKSELESLQGKKTEIGQKVRNGVTDFTSSIESIRITLDNKNAEIEGLQNEIKDMTKKMQAHRDEHKMQMDQIKGNAMNDEVHTLSSPDDFAKLWTEAELKDALQGIGPDWENLQQPMGRVVVEMSSQTDPVADMRKMLDEGALDGLNVSSEILEQLRELKEQGDALAAAAAAREKISDPIQDLLLRHEHEMHTLAITELQGKFAMLEDDLYQIKDMIKHDRARMEFKHGTKYEEEIRNVFLQNEPDKTRNLAYVVNDQLHDIRDDIITMEEDLKIKGRTFVEIPLGQAKLEPVETPLEQTQSAGFKDTDNDALLKLQNANSEEELFAYFDEQQVNKADRAEVEVATQSDEIQVNKAIRTEVEVATYCDELLVNKADRTEVDVKADKRTMENHSLFDTKTNDINKMIKHILHNLAVKDQAWNQQCKVFSDDIDRKLNHSELKSLKEWLLRRLKALSYQLNEENQAPVRRLQALNDKLPTGDTSTFSSSSGSNSLFDTETNDISKMIKEILNIIAVNEEAWNQQCKVFGDDIDGKLDGLELKPVKEWLLRRLKKLNDKLKKQNRGHVRRLEALNDMLPTGPVPSSMKSVSSHQALHPTISPRPDVNFEMDQILQHAKSSDTVKQKDKKHKTGQKVLKFISKVMNSFRKAKSQ